ncbi:sulfatase-like hydrolase/transferase [Puniceicoccaceae bacterium K14]|nr:sulfatase-like hydrolase/transferase [Puniceicoccaceae bacterium K14]
MSSPNVLFVIADDHRFSAIEALGRESVATPFIDELMSQGTAMSGARIIGSCQGAVCIPTRASIHTGVNHFKNAPLDNDMPGMALRPELPLLAEVFQKSGYRTFATGKWHNDRASFNRSFDSGKAIFFGGMADHFDTPLWDYDPTGEYGMESSRKESKHSTEIFCDAAIDFIVQQDKGTPFFAYLALTSPHDPRTAPTEYHSLYPAESIDLPSNFTLEHPFDNGELAVRDECLAAHPRSESEIKKHISDYYAMITHHDRNLSRVNAALEAMGLEDNTIIVYMADHGLAVGQHGLMGKQNVYDHSIRVPLIVKGPGIKEGQKRSELIYSYDIHPTLLDMCGLDHSSTIEAESFFSALSGDSYRPRETLYTHYCDKQATVTDGRWKLIRYFEPSSNGHQCVRQQLFDLENDPYETCDRSEEAIARAIIERLTQAMFEWQTQLGDPLGRSESVC